jgi:hypothetical protein
MCIFKISAKTKQKAFRFGTFFQGIVFSGKMERKPSVEGRSALNMRN